ncbi:MAG: hypothetical protein ACRC8A_06385 [Microcoleaceae cyanobacterium]
MPRLVGSKSNKNLYIGLAVLAAVSGLFGLEYLGVIDMVPGFGREPILTNQQELDVPN